MEQAGVLVSGYLPPLPPSVWAGLDPLRHGQLVTTAPSQGLGSSHNSMWTSIYIDIPRFDVHSSPQQLRPRAQGVAGGTTAAGASFGIPPDSSTRECAAAPLAPMPHSALAAPLLRGNRWALTPPTPTPTPTPSAVARGSAVTTLEMVGTPAHSSAGTSERPTPQTL